jgi:hypothetical protein
VEWLAVAGLRDNETFEGIIVNDIRVAISILSTCRQTRRLYCISRDRDSPICFSAIIVVLHTLIGFFFNEQPKVIHLSLALTTDRDPREEYLRHIRRVNGRPGALQKTNFDMDLTGTLHADAS